MNLFPHQRDGAEWLTETEGFGLLDWPMGGCKTGAAIEGINRLQEKSPAKPVQALIICMAVAGRNWVRELNSFLDAKRLAAGLVAGPQVQLVEKGSDTLVGDIIICSYALATKAGMQAALAGRGFTIVILDEVQAVKNLRAQRTQKILGFGANRNNGIVTGVPYVWGLSGTPAPNNLSEMYPWLRACSPETLMNGGSRPLTFDGFIRHYCKGMPTPFGYKIYGNNLKTLPEFLERLEGIHFRLEAEDILAHLPPLHVVQAEVDGGELAVLARREADLHADEIIAALENGATPGDHVARVRRLLELAKVPAVIDMIGQELSDGAYDKIVVFAHHREVIRRLEAGLKEFQVAVVHGGVTGRARQQAIDSFQDGDARVFVGQSQAAGTSITLHAHGRCANAVALSLDWSPGANAQAFARIHRQGQTNRVYIRVMHLADSVDARVNDVLLRKTKMLNEIFNAEETADDDPRPKAPCSI